MLKKSIFVIIIILFSIPGAWAKQTWNLAVSQEGQDNYITAMDAVGPDLAWLIGATSNSGNTQLVGYRSTDGASFSQIMLPQPSSQGGMVMFSAIRFIDQDNGFLAGMEMSMPFKNDFEFSENIVWKTTNGGMNWEVLDDSFDEMFIKMVKDINGAIYGITSADVYFSNGNSAFTKGTLPALPQDASLNNLQMLDGSIGYLVGGTGPDSDNPSRSYGNGFVFKTTDGGSNWTVLHDNFPMVVTAVYFINETRGWISGNDAEQAYIYYTDDGGQNWTQQSLPWHDSFTVEFESPFKFTETIDSAPATHISDLKFFDCNRGVALGTVCLSNCEPDAEENPTAVTMFYRTYDAGATWELDQHYEEAMNGWGEMMPENKFMSSMITMAFPSPNHGYIGGQHLMALVYDAAEPEEEPALGIPDCSGGSNNNNTNNSNNTNNGTGDTSTANDDGCGCAHPGKSSGKVPFSSLFLIAGLFCLIRRIKH
ncbi:MAG: WD40/YVTN/BNR-like repeat-containing protein [Myxococcota bacterium]